MKRMQTKRQAHGDATAARDLARDVAALPRLPMSKGRDIRIVESSGHGKNVAGRKVTSTFQVRDYTDF